MALRIRIQLKVTRRMCEFTEEEKRETTHTLLESLCLFSSITSIQCCDDKDNGSMVVY